MVIVITGAPYSGRRTMALSVIRSQLNAVPVPITTTSTNSYTDDLKYSSIPEEEFLQKYENGEFVGCEKYCGHLFGILKSDLDNILKTGAIAIIMVEPAQARFAGRKFCESNIRAVCLYMHCSTRAMLFRMAAAARKNSVGGCPSSYEDILEIYANNAVEYSNLQLDYEKDEGFDRVIPVNSDSLTGSCYPQKVIGPILGTLRNLVRVPFAKSI